MCPAMKFESIDGIANFEDTQFQFAAHNFMFRAIQKYGFLYMYLRKKEKEWKWINNSIKGKK